MKKILFASFESLPFIKTGGLADVVYALPKAIDKSKFEVRVCLPLLKKIKDKYQKDFKYLDHFEVHSGYIHEEANVYSYVNEGVEYLFIENDNYFYRDNVYGYDDDASRFAFYNVAILEMMIKLNYYPDVVHEHDYHTAVLSALAKTRFAGNENIRKMKHVFTIHNLVYQGEYNKQVLFDLLALDYVDYENGNLRYKDYANFMKIGITYADIVTTVSKTYSDEIQTSEYGYGLESILQYRNQDLVGIVNGIDVESFNPNTDKAIHCNYTIDSYEKGKRENKASLQYELGLNNQEDTMLVGMVSRLTFQKGAELVLEGMEHILDRDIQIAILGTGEEKYESAFAELENRYKGKFVYYRGYNEPLSHKMYAGLDMLLMPSLFEPCGISQLIAMRYGTLPLVRETGGLKDTVEPFNEYTLTGRGFSFGPYNVSDFLRVFDYAYYQYANCKDRWDCLVKNAMNYDVSFDKSAREYEDLYNKVLTR